MSYLVLARKYRPKRFSEVQGQIHIVKTLQNAVKKSQIAHAYIFAGPRGVGKTSVARIFAKALNCLNRKDAEPCLKCHQCITIDRGVNLAVSEIDGASHNSVENVRDLIESFRAVPGGKSRYKVYIIDEVHMLTSAAFNALLKSLEEPPPNTVFILATTEPHKIIPTVTSRCQTFDFKKLNVDIIFSELKKISKQEKIPFEEKCLKLISRLAEGSLRDAQSLLDRVRAFCEDKITSEQAAKALGIASDQLLGDLVLNIFKGQPNKAMGLIDEIILQGYDITVFLKQFADILGWSSEIRFNAAKEDLFSEELKTAIKDQVMKMPESNFMDLIFEGLYTADRIARARHSEIMIKALAAKLAVLAKSFCPPEKNLIEKEDFFLGKKNNLPNSLSGTFASSSLASKSNLAVKKEEKPKVFKEQKFQKESALSSEPQEREETACLENSDVSPLQWREFLNFIKLSGENSLLLSYLTMCEPQQFIEGVLELEASPVIYSTLVSKEELIINLLKAYYQKNNIKWRVKFNCAKGSSKKLLPEEQEEENFKKEIEDMQVMKKIKEIYKNSKILEIKGLT